MTLRNDWNREEIQALYEQPFGFSFQGSASTS